MYLGMASVKSQGSVDVFNGGEDVLSVFFHGVANSSWPNCCC